MPTAAQLKPHRSLHQLSGHHSGWRAQPFPPVQSQMLPTSDHAAFQTLSSGWSSIPFPGPRERLSLINVAIELCIRVQLTSVQYDKWKSKFSSWGTKADEELLQDKERVAKKPRVEAVRHITRFKLRAREGGDQTALKCHRPQLKSPLHL
ncbi:hypothetical protein BDN67DRAFT_1032696 [Paxillus ammoniavirescens]|nr:hypothetical protein BDN67DRAFT_1032696 [Paxillus ammoniavirescens]